MANRKIGIKGFESEESRKKREEEEAARKKAEEVADEIVNGVKKKALPLKTFLEWENRLIDVIDIRGIELLERVPENILNPNNPFVYTIQIKLYQPPYWINFDYHTEEVRIDKLAELKKKMKERNIKFI